MKKAILTLTVCAAIVGFIHPTSAVAYNFGDFRSETLTTKAWEALKAGDIEGVLAYTNKNLELYGEQAKTMQDGLEDYPAGSNEDIFAYWALNDVATSLFIQGEAYRREDMKDEAIAALQKLVNEYSFGQAWDPNGWFWKPAEAAKEKLAQIDSGVFLDFGDYTSAFLTTQAWKALPEGNIDTTLAYTDKVVELYEKDAAEMQNSLTEYPWQSKEQIFNYWALNDVGTSLFIKGEALKNAGKTDEAKLAYKQLIDKFYYAQCWDPQGWFWKPAEAAQEALDALGEI